MLLSWWNYWKCYVLHVFLVVSKGFFEQQNRPLSVALRSFAKLVDNQIDLSRQDINPLAEVIYENTYGNLLILRMRSTKRKEKHEVKESIIDFLMNLKKPFIYFGVHDSW